MTATVLRELNDREKMDFSAYTENLKTHEMEIKVGEEKEPPKNKFIVFSHPYQKKKMFLCSLERWARFSTLREERTTSKSQDNFRKSR